MAVLHGSVDMLDDETGIFEDEHEFESSAQEFIKQNNWQEAATDKIDFSKHKELHSMNVINITGILSNDESIRTIPWTPVKKLPAKPIQPPSRPTPCYKSQLSWSQELVNRSQQTTPGNLFDSSIQTLASSTADLSVQTELNDKELVADSSDVAAAVAQQAEVDQLKEEVAGLVYMNNRYHLAISNLTFLCLR